MLFHRSMLIASAGLPFWRFNPADATAGMVFTNGNRTASAPGGTRGARGNRAMSSGKHYLEIKVDINLHPQDGIYLSEAGSAVDSPGVIGWQNDSIVSGGSALAVYSVLTAGDIVGIAVDVTAHKVWFAKNGVWQGGGNPATGTGGLSFSAAAGLYPQVLFAVLGLPKSTTIPYPRTYLPPAGFNSL